MIYSNAKLPVVIKHLLVSDHSEYEMHQTNVYLYVLCFRLLSPSSGLEREVARSSETLVSTATLHDITTQKTTNLLLLMFARFSYRINLVI
jgi:hypothetical protein